MARLAQSTSSTLEKRATPFSCGYSLFFCLLMLATALLGAGQALALFFASTQSPVMTSHQSWLYFVFSSALVVLYLQDAIKLCMRNESELNNSSFILLHSYLTLVADIVLLVYYFCLPVSLEGLRLGAVALYATMLSRIAICYNFSTFVKCKLIYE